MNALRHGRGETTFAEYGADRLSRVCHAVGLGDFARDAAGTFRKLVEPWGDRPIGGTPVWPSDIVDDHTPFEISVTVGGKRSEVRVLVEAQGDAPTLRSQRDAARALSKRLERELGASLQRLHQVEDLFLPDDPKGIFAMWHAVSFRSDGKLDLKAYLNLQARGRALAPALAEEALVRLGFDRAWPALSQIGGRRGFDEDELLYFALDLSDDPDARVKLYFRHHRPTARDLEDAIALPRSPGAESGHVPGAVHAPVTARVPVSALAAGSAMPVSGVPVSGVPASHVPVSAMPASDAPFSARKHAPGEVTQMCRALGGGDGPLAARAPVSCFSYVGGDPERPAGTTVYFPITGYVTDDREAKALISAHLTGLGVSAALYEQAVDAFTPRPLEDGVGMQSYVSFRHEGGVPRLTVYFGPEAYSTQPPRARPFAVRPAPPLPSPSQIAQRYEAEPVTDHPFFRRLRREPAHAGRARTLVANLRVALVDDLPRMLSSVVARVEDDRIRCLLARQLDDELGNGDWSRARRALFAKLEEALAPSAAAATDVGAPVLAPVLAPGHALGIALGRVYLGADAYQGVGATLVLDAYSEQLRRFVSEELGRLGSLDAASLAWMGSPARQEGQALAALVPGGAPSDAAARGAKATAAAMRACFDGLYELCFG